MQVINDPRRSGKTTRLMAMAKELGYPVITFSEHRVRELRLQYHYGLVFTMRSWKNAKLYNHYNNVEKVLVDDLDLVLYHELGIDVEAITLTEDTEEHDALMEELVKPFVLRLHSHDPAPGCEWNAVEGCYVETDETFRTRIKNSLKE